VLDYALLPVGQLDLDLFRLFGRRKSLSVLAIFGFSTFLTAAAISPTLAAEEPESPKGATVTVLKASKTCFDNIVEVSGIIMAREETQVRPERCSG
jgi:HlyD family secretion protein